MFYVFVFVFISFLCGSGFFYCCCLIVSIWQRGVAAPCIKVLWSYEQPRPLVPFSTVNLHIIHHASRNCHESSGAVQNVWKPVAFWKTQSVQEAGLKTCLVFQVYVLKRPHVDEFLKRMGELFECVLFTASLAKYADPVSDLLDKWGAFRCRLFRESCVFHRGNYVKDLSRLGRDLNKVIIVDNSPASYIFHPDNAVPVASWFDDMSDTELLDLIPFFERLSKVDNVYTVLKHQGASS